MSLIFFSRSINSRIFVMGNSGILTTLTVRFITYGAAFSVAPGDSLALEVFGAVGNRCRFGDKTEGAFGSFCSGLR